MKNKKRKQLVEANNGNESITKLAIGAIFLGGIFILSKIGYSINGSISFGSGITQRTIQIDCTPNGGRKQNPSPSGARIPQGRPHPLVSSGKK